MQTSNTTQVGVIGSGSFGIAISTLLAHNNPVLLFSRRPDNVEKINRKRKVKSFDIPANVEATGDLARLCDACKVIFPAVPSGGFRQMMRKLSPHLKPSHYIIHCTKGFDIKGHSEDTPPDRVLSRSDIRTMSEVIREESIVLRIGCLSGPNLAREILDGQPTATVIASEFNEVIERGQDLLSSPKFYVFGSHDIVGAELAGALKNIIALGSGFLRGKGLGKNMQAMMITRGLHEIVYFGKAMGADTRAFLGTAGIGDLIATSTSKDSRNFSVGRRLGKGEKLEDVLASMDEVAEGLRTLKIARQLATYYKIRVPITEILYKLVFEDYDFDTALNYLTRYKYGWDVDFL